MLFASATFLHWFLPLFLAAYFLTPKGWRSVTLALASYLFYGWWRPDFLILMAISTIVDWTAARKIVAQKAQGLSGKPWLYVSLFTNLGLLAYFKYANFGIDTLNSIFVQYGQGPLSQPWNIILPVGISFYTFQTLSYTIDVYRGTAEPARRFRDFACYVCMFPQLVAGPIVRYNTIADQLENRTHTWSKFQQGVLAFQSGLAKKVLIADVLASVADGAFDAQMVTTADAWLGSLAYTFQIYFDFSGYSDMAIGLGLMIGFRFPINFDQPYRSRSITEFWRRWHVSLSTWLRDYLYLPLGGNQRGARRTYINLALVMLLGGLWHGAAFTFLAWGAYQGTWLVIERLNGKKALHAMLPSAAQMGVTFLLVVGGWVLFRAAGMHQAMDVYQSMFGFAPDAATAIPGLFRPIHGVAFAAAGILVWFLPPTQRLVTNQPRSWVIAMQLLFVIALLHLHHEEHVPFLYFQF